MKNYTTSVLLLAAALSAIASTPLSAASKDTSPASVPVRALIANSHGGDQITRGDSRERVRSIIGHAKRELSRDVWLYHGFTADSRQANDHGCRNLMITFANDQVLDLKFVNEPAEAIIAATLKVPAMRNVARK